MMPFAVGITEGVAFGLIAHVVLNLASGRGTAVHPLLYVFAALFVARYALLPEGQRQGQGPRPIPERPERSESVMM